MATSSKSHRVIKNLLVVGSDIHAYSAAARLAVALRSQGVVVHLLEHNTSQAESESTVVALGISAHAFHKALSLKESDLIAHLDGVYNYGIAMHNWHRSSGIDCLFTWSPTGEIIDGVRFHHYANKLRISGRDVSFDAFSVAAIAASEQRFAHPKADSLADNIDYCYQFDRQRYRDLLSAFCRDQGVRVVSAQLQSTHSDEQGFIDSVKCSNDQELTIDFVFDATADSEVHSRIPSSSSNRPSNHEERQQWRDCTEFLPISWVKNETIKTDAGTPTIGTLVKSNLGCTRGTPLQGRVSYQHYFAEQQIGAYQQRIGYQREPWRGNCVAIGRAAGNLGDIIIDEYTPSHAAMERWLMLYPNSDNYSLLAGEYNRATTRQFQHILDANCTPFACIEDARVSVTDSLQHRLSLFKRTGCVAFYESDVLDKDQWVNLLIGSQCWPLRVDALMAHVSNSDIERVLQHKAQQIRSLVESMPQHDALLDAIRRAARSGTNQRSQSTQSSSN